MMRQFSFTLIITLIVNPSFASASCESSFRGAKPAKAVNADASLLSEAVRLQKKYSKSPCLPSEEKAGDCTYTPLAFSLKDLKLYHTSNGTDVLYFRAFEVVDSGGGTTPVSLLFFRAGGKTFEFQGSKNAADFDVMESQGRPVVRVTERAEGEEVKTFFCNELYTQPSVVGQVIQCSKEDLKSLAQGYKEIAEDTQAYALKVVQISGKSESAKRKAQLELTSELFNKNQSLIKFIEATEKKPGCSL